LQQSFNIFTLVLLKPVDLSVLSSSMTAMQHKQEGNRLFGQKKYEEAIKQYTKAIVSNRVKTIIV